MASYNFFKTLYLEFKHIYIESDGGLIFETS